jgi:pimeloyl-ACP methyl ester carboxylesterase
LLFAGSGVYELLISCSYSGGPLPEELIPTCPKPVGILWGAEDPWEKVEWGRKLAEASTVTDYVELDKVGHCPQDESPQRVNPEIQRFVQIHA